MVKILFLINTLGGGGAEKVLVNLVNNMDKTKFDITVETMFDGGINAGLLKSDVKYVCKKALDFKGYAYFFRFIPSKLLYKFFIGDKKYDIIVAYMHGAPVRVIEGNTDKNVKKLAWLHNGNPETGTFFKFWKTKNDAISAYSKCDFVVGVSGNVLNSFLNYTNISTDKGVVVYNTNDCERIYGLSEEYNVNMDKGIINIVSVGRLGKEKGYDRLFSVCKRLINEDFNINVYVIGDGSEYEVLNRLIKKENADKWFKLLGFKSNPYPYVKNTDLFVCSSYTEGLSTAVTEAIILGKPVVSTDVSGAKEILGYNNEFGIVTDNNEEALYEGIKKMISTEGLLEYYGKKAKERAEFFSTEKTVKQAEDLFLSVSED